MTLTNVIANGHSSKKSFSFASQHEKLKIELKILIIIVKMLKLIKSFRQSVCLLAIYIITLSAYQITVTPFVRIRRQKIYSKNISNGDKKDNKNRLNGFFTDAIKFIV